MELKTKFIPCPTTAAATPTTKNVIKLSKLKVFSQWESMGNRTECKVDKVGNGVS
jgi:hypothetical protein